MTAKLTPATVRALLDRATKGDWTISKVRRGLAITCHDGRTVGAAHVVVYGDYDERAANAALFAASKPLAAAYLEALAVIEEIAADAELDALVARLARVSLDLGCPSTTTIDSAAIRQAADAITALRAELAAERDKMDDVTGLRVVMVSSTLEDAEDLPDEPSVILCGPMDAVAAAARLFGESVTISATKGATK